MYYKSAELVAVLSNQDCHDRFNKLTREMITHFYLQKYEIIPFINCVNYLLENILLAFKFRSL